ncbi:MAG: 4-hydroxy-tetrahydrodipicolinate synthase [Chitinophagales bacterium]
MNPHLKGVGVALVTPFQNNGNVDFAAYKRLIDHVIEGGVDYVVALGTTGESPTLSIEEKYKVLDKTIEFVRKRVPVVGGFGGNNTQYVLKTIKGYHFNGVDAILSVSPAYSKPTQEGIFQHYKAIAAVSPRPIILYNVPSRTGSNMTASTTLRLAAECLNVVAMKEASGNLVQCMEIVNKNPRKNDFWVVSGDDIITLPMIGFGIDGVISVIANATPKAFSEMVHAALKGDFVTARKRHFQLMELTQLIFAENNPGGVKAALSVLGICEENFRLPVVPVSRELKEKIEVAVGKLS